MRGTGGTAPAECGMGVLIVLAENDCHHQMDKTRRIGSRDAAIQFQAPSSLFLATRTAVSSATVEPWGQGSIWRELFRPTRKIASPKKYHFRSGLGLWFRMKAREKEFVDCPLTVGEECTAWRKNVTRGNLILSPSVMVTAAPF